MADPVAEHWPHLAALTDHLDALDGRTVTVAARTSPAVDPEQVSALLEALTRHERQGGAVPWKK